MGPPQPQTSESEVESSPVQMDLNAQHREDLILLLQQGLKDNGFPEFAERLMAESGVSEKGSAVRLKEAVLAENWTAALRSAINLCPDNETYNKIAYEVFQKRYIDELGGGNLTAAVKTLREELNPLQLYPLHTEQLAGLLLYDPVSSGRGRNLAEELTEKHWRISKEQLLDTIIEILEPGEVIPPHRLETLLARAQHIQGAKQHCHNVGNEEISLLREYHAGLEQLPVLLHSREAVHSDEIWILAFSPDGEYLASASKDKRAIVHTVTPQGDLVNRVELEVHPSAVSLLAWQPSGEHLMTCSDTEVRIWSVADNFKLFKKIRAHHRDPINACTWPPGGETCLTAGKELKTIIECNWSEGGTVKWMMKERVNDLVTVCDGQIIIAVVGDFFLEFMRSTDHLPVASISGKEYPAKDGYAITSINVSPDGEYLVANLKCHKCQLWHIGPLLRRILRKDVAMLVSNPYGLAPEGEDDEAIPRHPVMEYNSVEDAEGKFVIRSSLGGRDSAFLACGTEGGSICLWHRDTGRVLAELEGHSASVNCVAWNPRYPHMMASASDDRTIGVWVSPITAGQTSIIPVSSNLIQSSRLATISKQTLAHKSTLTPDYKSSEEQIEEAYQLPHFSERL